MVHVKVHDGRMALTIGELARATGVPTSTIRFWERKAVLPPPERRAGQRRYGPEAVEWVVLFRKCQEAGLTLAEIREFHHRATGQSAETCQDLLRDKLIDLERRIADLRRAHAMLTHATRCEHENITTCPVFREQLSTWTAAGPSR
jgi:DNA-binding transcriptional MerR regulator